jgi:hypothetical protein
MKRPRSYSESTATSTDPAVKRPKSGSGLGEFSIFSGEQNDSSNFSWEDDIFGETENFGANDQLCPACGLQVPERSSIEEHLAKCPVLEPLDEDNASAGLLKYPCPICRVMVPIDEMNEHLDICIQSSL